MRAKPDYIFAACAPTKIQSGNGKRNYPYHMELALADFKIAETISPNTSANAGLKRINGTAFVTVANIISVSHATQNVSLSPADRITSRVGPVSPHTTAATRELTHSIAATAIAAGHGIDLRLAIVCGLNLEM